MFETVLIPHGNQVKVIREIQNSFSDIAADFVPFEPFFMRFGNENPLPAVDFARAEEIQVVDGRVFLISVVSSGGVRFFGRILLGFLLSENISSIEKVFFMKKFDFPVFKIAKVFFIEEGFSVQWRISEEKWRKVDKNK